MPLNAMIQIHPLLYNGSKSRTKLERMLWIEWFIRRKMLKVRFAAAQCVFKASQASRSLLQIEIGKYRESTPFDETHRIPGGFAQFTNFVEDYNINAAW